MKRTKYESRAEITGRPIAIPGITAMVILHGRATGQAEHTYLDTHRNYRTLAMILCHYIDGPCSIPLGQCTMSIVFCLDVALNRCDDRSWIFNVGGLGA